MFTGNKDADRQILMTLNKKDLLVVCNLNSQINSLCNDNFFRSRFPNDFPGYINYKPEHLGWKRFYLETVKAEESIGEICEFIKRKIEKGKLHNETFYIDVLYGKDNDDAALNYIFDKLKDAPSTYGISPEEYFPATYNRYFKNSPYGKILDPNPGITQSEINFIKEELISKPPPQNTIFPDSMLKIINNQILIGRVKYNVKIGELCNELKK